MCCDRYARRSRHRGFFRHVYVFNAENTTSVRYISVVVVVGGGDGRVPAYRRPISGGAVVAAVRRAHAPTVGAAHRLLRPLSLQERPQVQEAPVDERKRKRRRNRKYVGGASRGVQRRSDVGARGRGYRLQLLCHVFPVREQPAYRPTAATSTGHRLGRRQRLSTEKVQWRRRRGPAEKSTNGSEACILNNSLDFLSKSVCK